MKKLFYGLGAVAAVVTPVVAVVSCGSSSEAKSSVAVTLDSAKTTLTVKFSGSISNEQLKAELAKLNLTDAIATKIIAITFVDANKETNTVTETLTGGIGAPTSATDVLGTIIDAANANVSEAWLADCFELAA